MKRTPRLLPSTAALALLTAGCGTATTIQTRAGQEFQGQVSHGDPATITLVDGQRRGPPGPDEQPADAGAGEADRIEPFASAAIERSQIEDIDYPGNGLLVAGSIVGGLGLMVLLSPKKDSGPVDLDLGPSNATASMALLAGGAAMAVVGGIRYTDARDAARPAVDVGPGSVTVSGRF